MEPVGLGLALASRLGDLKNVAVSVRTPAEILDGMTGGGKESFCHRGRVPSSDSERNDR